MLEKNASSSRGLTSQHLPNEDLIAGLSYKDNSLISLINWLENPNADNAEIIAAMCEQSPLISPFFLNRFQSPSANILDNLSIITSSNPLPIFSQRLAEAVSWLASNDEYRSSCKVSLWCELFSLIRYIDPECKEKSIHQSLAELLSAFDKEITPSLKNREIRRDFPELLVSRQLDASMMPRWLRLVKDSNSDKCLYASLITL